MYARKKDGCVGPKRERRKKNARARSKKPPANAEANAHFAIKRPNSAKKAFKNASISFPRDSRRSQTIPRVRERPHFFFAPSPLSLSFRRKKTHQKNQRTGTSARKLHLITAQVRVRFVHGVGFLFRFSFTHGE